MTMATNESTSEWMPYPPTGGTVELQIFPTVIGRTTRPASLQGHSVEGVWAPWPETPAVRPSRVMELRRQARNA